mmetsp:Transcript_76175/g.213590  ORF Transcript_76175/g.213590 Transcript_76175/m.213590 type:complete len:259 (+) Transcript_76175:1004-1780(+)
MLDHWVLSENLCLVHLHEPGVGLLPSGHCGDVVQHRRGLVERCTLLRDQHLTDRVDIQVPVGVLPDDPLLIDLARRHLLLKSHELRCPEDERQGMEVVQAPHAMRASRLQHVDDLEAPHYPHVLGEHQQHEVLGVCLRHDPIRSQGEDDCEERRLMTCAVVDAPLVPEGAAQVASELRGEVVHAPGATRGSVALGSPGARGGPAIWLECGAQSSAQEIHSALGQPRVPLAERLVAKPHRLVNRGELPDPLLQLVQQAH